jgi:hypothetical protein
MKDQPKHTPGPWFAKRAGGDGYFEWYVGRDGENCSIAEDIADPMTRDPSEANAHLIAASPDLLESLKMMLEGGLEGPTPQAIDTALAAIAKAEGRAE